MSYLRSGSKRAGYESSIVSLLHEFNERNNGDVSRATIALEEGCHLAIALKIEHDQVRLETQGLNHRGFGGGFSHPKPASFKCCTCPSKGTPFWMNRTVGGGRAGGVIAQLLKRDMPANAGD